MTPPTAQFLLDAAYNRSTKNQANILVANATEGLQLVIRAVQGLYAFAARMNPIFFGKKLTTAFGSVSWPRPSDAESIYRLEQTSTQTEIVVVPWDDRNAEPSKPAVYEFGQQFFPASNSPPNVISGNIDFWYSRRPVAPATVADTIDSQWPDAYNSLLILEVAIYLAIKDGRLEEVPALREERNSWVALYSAFLEHATANLRARFGQVRRFTTNSLIPIQSLLAGAKQQ